MEEDQIAEPASEGTPESAAEGTSEPDDDDLLDEQADAAEDFVNGLLDVLGLDGEATADIDDADVITVDIEGDELAVLIGRHGATLDALQEVTRAAVQQTSGQRVLLRVDIAGYRERQQEMLERRALRLADTAKRSGKPVSMDPMNAFERRIVHNALADVDGVATTSEGEDPERYVVIRPSG